ncbi:MAG TPA: TlpA disulfide reductase family protein [Fimbriimonadaceae bacterium]|jgi:thiol-disulfide isomerase/thioredoxin
MKLNPALISVLVLSSAFGFGQQSHYLTVGDPAPQLRPAKWLKGAPIEAFQKGQVYVVEFWATWCEPCKESIPHLTDMAHKLGSKASFIGVSIWESNDPTDTAYQKKVATFVQKEGAQMDYTIAVDGPKQPVANFWMKSAEESGIPTCFVVGQDGRIAWIGHPSELEPVLNDVIANHFDVQAARARREVNLELIRPVDEALEAKKYDVALKRIDEAVAKKPSLDRFYTYDRLVARFHLNWENAKSISDGIIKDSKGEIGAYRMIASILATQPDLAPGAYRYGVQLVDEALKEGEMGYLFLAMKSDIYSNLGDNVEAEKTQQDAVSAAEKDSHAPADFVAQMKRKLTKLEDGLAHAK